MQPRLELVVLHGAADVSQALIGSFREIAGARLSRSVQHLGPLISCSDALAKAGARSVIVQRRVTDPDFLAEYAAYYSRQFFDVDRKCTRLHFFSEAAQAAGTVLDFLDAVDHKSYLGFVTLRPIPKSPIAASILSYTLAPGVIRSKESFPVHIAGVELRVAGTPFMQQDNAVGACAQASIWMALRTLQKREGDRAHTPAQITDNATRYAVQGRVKPNRQGLTVQQIAEAVRAAGYSPHAIALGDMGAPAGQPLIPANNLSGALATLHAYVESNIPVLLLLFPPSGGHAVVVVGHTWSKARVAGSTISVQLAPTSVLLLHHASEFTPELIANNDNAGPYQAIPLSGVAPYTLEYAGYGIPLLPGDVFMTAEEATAIAQGILREILQGINAFNPSIAKQSGNLIVRLLLVEKRQLRAWAAKSNAAAQLAGHIRVRDLPRRVWICELHTAKDYGNHIDAAQRTQVGLVLIDPTGDDSISSVLCVHLNLPVLVGEPHGLLFSEDSDGKPLSLAIKTDDTEPALPISTAAD